MNPAKLPAAFTAPSITWVSNHRTAFATSFVTEAAPEKLELKQQIFQRLDAICAPDTILATNTSVIPVTDIGALTKHRQRVLGTHYWNPPYAVRLVEVVQTAHTAPEAIDRTMGLMTSIGQLPVHVKRDVPGFFLQTVTQARAILKELGRPNLKVQFDAYHAQIMEGDLTTLFRACIPDLGHIQIANPPDRHEPDRGEINYPFFFEEVDRSGYDGWINGEYVPTEAGLGYLQTYAERTA